MFRDNINSVAVISEIPYSILAAGSTGNDGRKKNESIKKREIDSSWENLLITDMFTT